MKLFHQDMVLETPAFGTTARGLVENETALAGFFRSSQRLRSSDTQVIPRLLSSRDGRS